MPEIKRHGVTIASITMIGQFPTGIDLHVRNLKWFLHGTNYHIYIITTPEVFEQTNVKDEKVTFITKPVATGMFKKTPSSGFINFWWWFPTIVKHYNINPNWFLFMEQDIWFYDKFDKYPKSPKTIKTFLPVKGPYHNVMLDDKLLHKRVWEGSHMVHGDVVRRAMEFPVNFSFYAKSFLDKFQDHYEKKFGGKLCMSKWSGADTMDEFTLYCALEERTDWEEVDKAVHVRGAETVSRHHPHIYNGCDQKGIDDIKDKIWYIDIYMALAVFYIAGNWNECNVNWKEAKYDLRRDLRKVAKTSDQWMTQDQNKRLQEILSLV